MQKNSIWRWLLLFSLFPMLLLAKTTFVTSILPNNTQNSVSICATMKDYSYNNSSNKSVMKTYVKIVPNHSFTTSWSYRRLCIDGLKPNTSYTINLYKDMPLGANTLDKDYRFESKTTNYAPSVSFPEEGYILPTKGEITIPVETTNLGQLSVSLYRINSRNLIKSINKYGLFRTISSYSLEDIENKNGYLLWEKTLNLGEKTPNISKLTAIPVGDFLQNRKAGVYILFAQMLDEKGKEIYDYDSPTQWFMVSDIGLYTLKSSKGLDVLTKALSTAKPYNDVRLELISKNNEILDTVTSKDGHAFFPASVLRGEKGLKAKAIYAYGANDDFSVLDLSKPAHDLSDRGVSGRENLGEYGAFIYSNRDIFRPSESITFHALLRDQLGKAKSGLNLSVKVFDARGVEVYSKQLSTDTLGHLSDTLEIAESASTGKWRVAVYAGAKTPIGTYHFLVEDFVPPKIKLEVQKIEKQLKPKEEGTIGLVAKYLNGEVFPHAQVEVSTIIHKSKYLEKAYKEYLFGNIKERFGSKNLTPLRYETDENGVLSLPFKIEKSYATSFPLSAHIDIAVSELGGRPLHHVIEQGFANKAYYIGIKPLFDNHAVDRDSKAKFDLMYLKENQRSHGRLHYELIEEKTHWYWSSTVDSWEYYKSYSDNGVIRKGEIETLASDAVSLVLDTLDWGSYRLKVYDDNKTLTTYRFSSGYEESNSKSSPDRLPVSVDKQSYKVGDMMTMNIKPKFTGPIEVYIAQNDLIEHQRVEGIAGEDVKVSFEVRQAWGSAVYVLASSFRVQSKKLGANRAIGIVPIHIKHPEHEMKLSLVHPSKTTSNSTVVVKIDAPKASALPTEFTLAAVDEGILNLTNYQTPNPLEYFFGQQTLGIEIRDLYDSIIQARGTHAKFNVGAGDIMLMMPRLEESSVRNKREVVALFTKKLTFDANGTALVSLDIPDYQGALKLIALAWNAEAIGVTQSTLIVKDKISIEYYMPLFLSVGDSVETLLSIDFDKSLDAGNYQIQITTQGGVVVAKENFDVTIGNEVHKISQSVMLEAKYLKDATVCIEVYKEGKVVKEKSFELGIRTPYPQTYVRQMDSLQDRQTLDPSQAIDLSQWSAVHSLSLKISTQALLPTESFKNELIDYAGRCAEQTTSRAMPWLFTDSKEHHQTIQNTIARLMTYQNIEGGFGLWLGSGVDMWLSAYVLDFLTRAKDAGYTVANYNINKGLDWIENHLNRWEDTPRKQEADAYGLYVLTRANRILMSEIQYHVNNPKSKIASAQAWGHLGASLAYVGEKALAQKVFAKAQKSLGASYGKRYYNNYGGALRDHASLISLMAESKAEQWQKLYYDLTLNVKKEKYLSTQELSALLRVSSLLENTNPKALKLRSKGKELPLEDGKYFRQGNALGDLPIVTNVSGTQSWYDLSFQATPISMHYDAKNNNGFSISKSIYTLKGKKIDMQNIIQNERLVVVLRGKIEHYAIENPLISDWLPSGFELENPHLTGINAVKSLAWLGQTTPSKHESYRNDRFDTALEMNFDTNNTFQVAYIVRAVSRGEFILAPVKIEDMYQPRYRAFSSFVSKAIEIKKESKQSPRVVGLSEKAYLSVYHTAIKTLASYDILELNILRNAIFAQAGLDFEISNPMLHKKFMPFTWYHRTTTDSSKIYHGLSPVAKANVHTLLDEEKRRGGGLVLADFYRVYHISMDEKLLAKYDKKSLHILRNSLFARYGLVFKEKSLQTIFDFMPWYTPQDISVSEIFDRQMNDLEKANIRLMLKLEKAL